MRSKDPILSRWGMKSLSQKLRYDKFVNLYMVSGKAEESYLSCFPESNPLSAKKSAHRLVRHRYVVSEINRKYKIIDEQMTKEVIMNRERILKELEEILVLTKGKEQYPSALKALDQLARVTGAYAPEKQEVEHKGITINYIEPEQEDDCNGECGGGCGGDCQCDI